MDFILDVLILKSDLDKLSISEEFVGWGGEKFSREPARYTYKSILTFHENTGSYYQEIRGDFDLENYVALCLDTPYLSELEFVLNNQNSKEIQSELINFLKDLYNTLDLFFVFLFRDEECIDNKYFINTQEELINIFCRSLKWDSPEGILLAKGSNLK